MDFYDLLQTNFIKLIVVLYRTMGRKSRAGSEKKEQKKIASDRIKELFKQASLAFREDPKLSNRYVTLARNLSMKYNLRIPSILKRKFCKHCYIYLRPGKNCRVRTKNRKVVYSCPNCKKFMRFPLKQRK